MELYILTVGLVLFSAILGLIWFQLKKLTDVIESGIHFGTSDRYAEALDLKSGYAIWIWQDKSWVLQEDLSKKGYQPSAPGMEGAFEGHIVKSVSMPQR